MSKTHTYNFKEGATVLIDKPLEWTSFDVVKRVRNITKAKTGHAGTLDPLATGLLILCTGKNTKKIESLQGMDKEYRGTFFLGATRPSFDKETEVDQEFPTEHISKEDIKKCAESFIGTSEQAAPIYSALKVDGKRMYEAARKGEEVKAKIRPVTIHEFEIEKVEMPLVYFRIKCSKGTYIRSIANDFGKKLNSGAYLNSLIRTKIGDLLLEDAWNLEEFTNTFRQTKNQVS